MSAFIPKSFHDGETFERFVQHKIFTNEHYTLLDKTPGFEANKKFDESCLKPDFKFRVNGTTKDFYLEAKYRSNLTNDDYLNWCKPYQYERYNSYSDECPVFVIIGLAGYCGNPNEIFVLPLNEIDDHLIPIEFCEAFKIYKYKFPATELLPWLG